MAKKDSEKTVRDLYAAMLRGDATMAEVQAAMTEADWDNEKLVAMAAEYALEEQERRIEGAGNVVRPAGDVGILALTPKLSNAAASAAADAVVDLLDNGYIRIYDGTQATDADTAVGAQVLLAELRWNATAFGAASNGVATANAITSDSSANATGTASWFRALSSNGTTVIFDGSVGVSSANLNLNSVSISSGATVAISSFTYTQAKA
jgi:hypothetical protein